MESLLHLLKFFLGVEHHAPRYWAPCSYTRRIYHRRREHDGGSLRLASFEGNRFRPKQAPTNGKQQDRQKVQEATQSP